MQQKNLLLFFTISLLIMIGYVQVRQRFWPPPPVAEKAVEKPDVIKPDENGTTNTPTSTRGSAARLALGLSGAQALKHRNSTPHAPAPAEAPPTESAKLIHLGQPGGEEATRFHLEADLDPRGAGVRNVVLNKFAAADKEGRPEWKDEAKKIPKPLELIPGEANRETPAFALFHYDSTDPLEDHPLNTLGHVVWNVVDKDHPVVEEKTADGRLRQRVSFQTEIQGVTITKTFTLTEGDYHLGLEVKLSKKAGLSDDKDRPFRYQLAGGRGLPIEGEWYTNTFRNALIAQVERGNVYRDLQDLRQISNWEGGNEVVRDKDRVLCYAGVGVQYFASVITVDDEQKRTDFLLRARPTLETAVTKGKIKSIAADKESFVLSLAGDRGERSFYVPPKSILRAVIDDKLIHEGQSVAVIHSTDGVMEDGKLRAVADRIEPQAQAQPLFIDDITVRVVTEPIELKPGVEVVHKYLLYNGPMKPMLLGQMTGAAAVPPQVVERYLDKLHLNTLTDYHTPGAMGAFASSIYWTDLIIKCTNLMHEVLNYLHMLIPNYGICIIVLTIMVRGMMFPVSRKQAMTSMRMQELAPELKKLQEKYKDDRQALGTAQMELYRKHGVNPFGSCWFLLLQMPIFMGLYYCLQESIHFRLAEFWPTWIINLAAPDMLFNWGNRIPIISRPEDYGGMLYLGPYFNLLPVIAVALMIVQQKYTMPPPADEQQEMQQKMMKYMMIFFGLMFYKVAAGLCVYFVTSSIWGFTERQLLPKKKTGDDKTPEPSIFQRLLKRGRNGPEPAAGNAASITATSSPAHAGVTVAGSPEARSGKRKKGKKRRDEAERAANATQDQESISGLRGWWRVRKEKLAAWWEEVLKQAEKR